MKVLITSALSARAYQLKSTLTADLVVLGDYNEVPDFMIGQGIMIQLPGPRSTSYAHQMLTLCLDNAIDIIYVMDVREVKELAGSIQLFAEYNIDMRLHADEV
jgi:hypothetical protein